MGQNQLQVKSLNKQYCTEQPRSERKVTFVKTGAAIMGCPFNPCEELWLGVGL